MHWFYLDEYLRLSDQVARLLFPRLHADRLTIQPVSSISYDYADFRRMGVTGSPADAIRLIHTGLDHLVTYGILVESFTYETDWRVIFLPLTDKEKLDIEWLQR